LQCGFNLEGIKLKEESSMKIKTQKWLVLFSLILWLTSSFLAAQTEEALKILDQNKDGVISFVTYGQDKQEISRGTGFIIGKDVMATAYHLVCQASSAEGKNYKGKKVKIEGILGVDKNFDLALLKVKGKRQVLALGSADQLESGKKVFAVGSNEAEEIIIAEGTIRDFLQFSPTQRIITSSFAIPDDFCGSPLLDGEGKVTGIIIFLDKSSKFILPVENLKAISKKAQATKFKNWQQEDYFSTLPGASLAGKVFALMDETAKARRYLEKVTQFSPDNIEAFELLSSVYDKERDYRSAVSAYKKVVELDDNRDKAHYGLGVVLLRMREYKEAITHLEKAAQLNMDNKEAYYHIGNAYEELKDFAKAAEAYQKFVGSKPENAWMGNLRLGLCRVELGDYEQAVAALKKAQEKKPQDIKINYNLAQALQKAGRFQEAEEAYKSLAAINPDDANVYYSTILRMYDEAGQNDKAIEAAKKLIELNPQSEINVYNLGIMYMKLERFDEAIDTFKKVLEIRPGYAYAFYNIGFCYSKQKKYKESIEAFEKFVELSPDSADGWFNIGVGYMLIKKFSKAIEPLQKSIELRPQYGLAYYNLAITFLNLKDNYSAQELHKKLVNIDPSLAQKLKKLLR